LESVAKNTTHPLDTAIVKEAEKRKITLFNVQDFEAIPGKGIRGKIDGKEVLLGNRRLIGIEKILAEVLPQDKEKEIRRLQNEGKVVGAVGDGINDAPMLAAADIGIAMGAGTDVAKETGGIILVKDDIRDVVKAVELSRKTFSKIKQNLFLAFFYNVLAIPIASGVFYHWPGFLLKPEIAALAMILSDISVVGNSLLLRKLE